MKRYVVVACILACVAPWSVTEAETVLRTGETVSVLEEQSVVGDFYVAAGITTVSGRVEGDLLTIAGKTTINGEVAGDALIIGGNVDVHGPVSDDVRVIGGEVIIAEPVAGDVFVLGGTVQILSTATVGGDVLIYAGNAEIAGSVGGDVLGAYQSLRLSGPVAGDVSVTAENLSIGDSAVIAGDVAYVSNNLVNRSPNAQIGGEIVRNDGPVGKEMKSGVQHWLVPMLILAFTTLVWFLFSRKSLQGVVLSAISYRPRPLLVGIIALLLLPIICVILFATMLGSLLALVLLFGYVLLALLSIIATPVVIGQLLLKVFQQPANEVRLIGVGVGLISVLVLSSVPLVGAVLLLLAIVVTFGALVDSLITLYNI